MRTIAIFMFAASLTFIPAATAAAGTTGPRIPVSFRGSYGAYQLGDDTLANEFRNAGLSFLARQYRWIELEPEQDEFTFNLIDTFYDDILRENDLYVVIILRTGQCWATDNQYDPGLGSPLDERASTPPLDYDDYYDFVYSVVEHFRGRINRFIIENDPLTKFSWYGTPQEYNFLVRTAYQAAKAANPDCVIIANKFPAMSFSHLIARDLVEQERFQEAIAFWNGFNARRVEDFQVETIDELLNWLGSDFSLWVDHFADVIMTSQQAAYMDALGFNYYLHYDYIDEVVGWLEKKMDDGGFSLPILDLEHGVKDEREELSDYTAAVELVKGYMIVHALDIPTVSWYPFTIDSVMHNVEYLKPLWDFENQEFLPPYISMQILSRHIGPFHTIGDVFIGNYRRYPFLDERSGRVDVDVVWSDTWEGDLEILFRRPATEAIVTTFIGNSVETIPNINDTLVVEVNGAPRFIRWIFED